MFPFVHVYWYFVSGCDCDCERCRSICCESVCDGGVMGAVRRGWLENRKCSGIMLLRKGVLPVLFCADEL